MAERLQQFLEHEFVPQPFIIGRGVLPVRGKMILGGDPKSNKSFIILNIAISLARGEPVFGARYAGGVPVLPVGKPWRVLYLEQELGEQGLLERLRGKEDRPGLVNGEAKSLEVYVTPRDTKMRLDTPEGREFIEAEIAGVKPDVVFLDPMAKFHLGDENSSQEMGAVMRVCDHIVERFGCAIVMAHHNAREYPDSMRRGGNRLRGSTAIFADVETVVEVKRLSPESHPEPVLELAFEMRRGEPIEHLFVQRMRTGKIQWLGEGYSFPSRDVHSSYPRGGKYQNL